MNARMGHTTVQTMLFALTMKGHIHANVKNSLVEMVLVVRFKGVKLEPPYQIETLVMIVLSTPTIAFLTAFQQSEFPVPTNTQHKPMEVHP